MRKFTQLLLSGPFPGLALYGRLNECDPQTGANSNKEPPPGMKKWSGISE